MEAGPTWPEVLASLIRGQDLPVEQSSWAMTQLLTGECNDAQLAGFLIALRAKGETVAELTGLVQAMMAHAVPLSIPGLCVDVVGTGGDRANTVNISTMAALVVAGAGQRVVKHGNRAASSACGAADVLEHLGVRLDLSPKRIAAIIEKVGITFCFAQVFHPAMRHAAGVRRSLGVPTAFNVLGPLSNPAQPAAAAIGCGDARMAPLMAGVLADRGSSALVFRGDQGLDEMSISGPASVWVVREGQVRHASVDPQALGLAAAPLAALVGGSVEVNSRAVRDVLSGQTGPVRDAVLLNAAAALVATELARGGGDFAAAHGDQDFQERLHQAFAQALVRTGGAIDSGAAAQVLTSWVALSADGH